MMLEQDFNAGLVDASLLPHKRFAIYRNNVQAALTGALRVRFPVVEQLVGTDFFNQMAGDYVAFVKPTSAVLIYYGASFAEFIAGYEGAAALSYLADVARFENAWWASYHAAESDALDPAALATLAPEDWGGLRFQFRSSVQLIHTQHAAPTIWQWHQIKQNSQGLTLDGYEYSILHRPEQFVDVRLISAAQFCFLSSLRDGHSLEDALLATQEKFPDFELQTTLATVFEFQLLSGFTL